MGTVKAVVSMGMFVVDVGTSTPSSASLQHSSSDVEDEEASEQSLQQRGAETTNLRSIKFSKNKTNRNWNGFKQIILILFKIE